MRTLIRWAGDDPTREGLLDTPARVVRAYEEFFATYVLWFGLFPLLRLAG